MVDRVFHSSPNLIGMLPFGSSAQSVRICPLLFLRINVNYPAVMDTEKYISKEIDLLFELETVEKIFKLACQLHGVGHATFSHTSKNLFKRK